jgi:hypothetical protein
VSGLGVIWAMLGPRSLIAIAVAALVLYGRSGVLRTRQAQTLWSWMSPTRRVPGSDARAPASPGAGGMSRGDRTFWFLTVLAATALAAWIVTRTINDSAPAVSH